jgi:hypothetical protein
MQGGYSPKSSYIFWAGILIVSVVTPMSFPLFIAHFRCAAALQPSMALSRQSFLYTDNVQSNQLPSIIYCHELNISFIGVVIIFFLKPRNSGSSFMM